MAEDSIHEQSVTSHDWSFAQSGRDWMTGSFPVKIECTIPEECSELDTRSPWCRKVFPTGFKQELKSLFRLSWPAALAYIFSNLMGVVSLMFCGQLGREELDAVGLALSLLNITGISVCFGFSTACDTLFSQAFGGKNKLFIGIYLQRSLIVITLTALVCCSIHLNTEGILIALGQNRAVSRLAGIYLLYFIPGLYFAFLYLILVRYLQNQNRLMPTVLLGGLGNLVNALAQYLVIYVFEFGLISSSLGQVFSYFLMLLCTVVYIFWSGAYKDTWSGWSWRALENWGQFLHLAIAGLVMTAIEWWSVEVGIFMNGILGEVELGATSVMFQIDQIIYMVPSGIGVASSIRVGQSLGAGRADAAMTTARVAYVLAAMGFLLVAVFMLSLRKVLPLLFTSDQPVIQLSQQLIVIAVIVAAAHVVVVPSMGTLRGCGRQLSAAGVNAVGYLGVALPLAGVFMFSVRIGASGFWWGLAIGVVVSAFLYIYIIGRRIKWEDEVAKTQKRIEEASVIPQDDEKVPLISENTGIYESTSVNSHISGFQKQGQINAVRKSYQISTTLLVKRLVSCVAVFGVLAAGICVRVFVPLPEEPEVPDGNSTSISTPSWQTV